MGAAIEGAIGQYFLEMNKVSIYLSTYLSCVSHNVHLHKYGLGHQQSSVLIHETIRYT